MALSNDESKSSPQIETVHTFTLPIIEYHTTETISDKEFSSFFFIDDRSIVPEVEK